MPEAEAPRSASDIAGEADAPSIPSILTEVEPTDSFSTTESIPSDTYRAMADKPEHRESEAERPKDASDLSDDMSITYLPTVEAYNSWASVYDTDGNVLQKMDDLELERMLPAFVEMILSSCNLLSDYHGPLRILDFGCGTARNTVKLLTYPWPEDVNVEIIGVDASTGMLAIAQQKLDGAARAMKAEGRNNIATFHLAQHDFLDHSNPTNPPILPASEFSSPSLSSSATALSTPFDAIISTLVLEHFPLPTFFATQAHFLSPGGTLLLTNMHPDMGARSQAGFISTGSKGRQVKVRGQSWAHGVQETVEEAMRWGFDVDGVWVEQRAVEKDMAGVGKVLGSRAEKWVGCKIWYGMVLRRWLQKYVPGADESSQDRD